MDNSRTELILRGNEMALSEFAIDTKELAMLKGCSSKYIQRLARRGDIIYIETVNERNRKKFLFPVEYLPIELKIKYYKQKYGDTEVAQEYIKSAREAEKVKQSKNNVECDLSYMLNSILVRLDRINIKLDDLRKDGGVTNA